MSEQALTAPHELSQEEHQQLVNDCFTIEQRIKAGMRKGREALWEVAEEMYKFDEARGWLVLGYETLGEWLADPEISMPRSTFNRLVQAWGDLVVVRKVDPPTLATLDLSKTSLVLAALRAGEVSTDKALADVQSMGANDLRKQYSKPRGGDRVQTPDPPAEEESWADVGPTDGFVEEEPVIVPADTDTNGNQADADTWRSMPTWNDYEFVRDLARVMWRISEEVAPPEKKRMSADLREEVDRVVKLAISAGLLDVE
jgi:hypothetical protein